MTLHAALLTVLAGAALVAVPAGPAAAAACSASNGVSVVVDFAALGGGTSRQCAADDPASGLAALRGAGFTPTRAAQQPGYFLCRIDGKPANDPCQRTSPANAYWSYWHAKQGGSWTYSTLGPADYDPAPGTVEGWAFGAGKPPSSAPPRATVASPSASPSASATPVSRASAAASPSPTATTARAAQPVASRAPTAASSPASSTSPDAAALEPSSPDPSPSEDAGGPGTVGRAIEVPHSSLTGPLVAAVVVALLLAGVAAAVVRRRRDERP